MSSRNKEYSLPGSQSFWRDWSGSYLYVPTDHESNAGDKLLVGERKNQAVEYLLPEATSLF